MWGRWTIIPWGFLVATVAVIRAVLEEEASPHVLIVVAITLAALAGISYWMLQRR